MLCAAVVAAKPGFVTWLRQVWPRSAFIHHDLRPIDPSTTLAHDLRGILLLGGRAEFVRELRPVEILPSFGKFPVETCVFTGGSSLSVSGETGTLVSESLGARLPERSDSRVLLE